MSSADDTELSAILADYEESVKRLSASVRNSRLVSSRNRSPDFRTPHAELSSNSPSWRSASPNSPDRELRGVRRGFAGRPDLLNFGCTLRPKPPPPVLHVRPLTPPSQWHQVSGAPSAGPQSGPMENAAPWRSLGNAKSHFRVKFG